MEKNTKIFLGTILSFAVLVFVLYLFVPSKETMLSCASETVQEELKQDEDRTRKQVTAAYNDLLCIRYASFEMTGTKGFSEKYVGFLGKVYDASEGPAKTVGQLVNYTYRMLGCGQSVLYGAKLTIFLTTLSMFFGLIISVFLALGKISKILPLKTFCSAYIFFFRGTPLMIQLFCIYLAIPGIFEGFSWRGLFNANDPDAVFKGAFLAAFIAFTLNTAAYCAEIVRSAIQSIDKGQSEAAKALGMGYAKTMALVILPQSIRRMLPPICNEFIMLLKDASLVFVIGLMDITTISKSIASNGSYLVFVPALVIYLIITAFFTFIFNKIEKHFSVYE